MIATTLECCGGGMDGPAVLIVDDDPAVRCGLGPVLETEGMVVSTAASLREAEGLLARTAFDLVITDLRLTGGGGREGLEVVSRARRALPGAVVVMFTAYGEQEVREDALRRGAVDLWEKSIPIPELLRRVRALGAGGGRPPGAVSPGPRQS